MAVWYMMPTATARINNLKQKKYNDMKRYRLIEYAYLATLVLGFTACSQDELVDGSPVNGTPVTFTASGIAMQQSAATRATTDRKPTQSNPMPTTTPKQHSRQPMPPTHSIGRAAPNPSLSLRGIHILQARPNHRRSLSRPTKARGRTTMPATTSWCKKT